MTELERDDTTDNDAEISTAVAERLRLLGGRSPLLLLAIFALVAVGLGLLVYSLAGSNTRPLYPILSAISSPSGTADYQVHKVSFTELNDDPASYQNQRLQVSGIYTPISSPQCPDHTGPIIRWSLVADGLQLNATGFEDLLRLVDEGIEMTVIGTWRRYHGPLGCGKEPAGKTVWYLEVDRIVEPNPLQGKIDPALTVILGSPEFPSSGSSMIEPAETGEAEFGLTPENTDIISPTITADIMQPTADPDLSPQSTPSPTSTLPTTPLFPVGTPTEQNTPDPLATATATTPPGTPGTVETPPPSIPTSTPPGSGYPPQSPTPSGGYP